jgi:hypothetical protein
MGFLVLRFDREKRNAIDSFAFLSGTWRGIKVSPNRLDLGSATGWRDRRENASASCRSTIEPLEF